MKKLFILILLLVNFIKGYANGIITIEIKTKKEISIALEVINIFKEGANVEILSITKDTVLVRKINVEEIVKVQTALAIGCYYVNNTALNITINTETQIYSDNESQNKLNIVNYNLSKSILSHSLVDSLMAPLFYKKFLKGSELYFFLPHKDHSIDTLFELQHIKNQLERKFKIVDSSLTLKLCSNNQDTLLLRFLKQEMDIELMVLVASVAKNYDRNFLSYFLSNVNHRLGEEFEFFDNQQEVFLAGDYINIVVMDDPFFKKSVNRQLNLSLAYEKIIKLDDSVLKKKLLYIVTKKALTQSSKEKFFKYYDTYGKYYPNDKLFEKLKSMNVYKTKVAEKDIIYNRLKKQSGNYQGLVIQRGKKIVYLWASWCSPCIAHIKEIVTHKAYKNNKNNIIFISTDKDFMAWKKSSVSSVLHKSYLFENFEETSINKQFKIDTIPRILMYENGKLVYSNYEFTDADSFFELIQ